MAAYNKFTPSIENLFDDINAGSDTWVVQAVQSYDHIDWTFKPLRRWDGSDWV